MVEEVEVVMEDARTEDLENVDLSCSILNSSAIASEGDVALHSNHTPVREEEDKGRGRGRGRGSGIIKHHLHIEPGS